MSGVKNIWTQFSEQKATWRKCQIDARRLSKLLEMYHAMQPTSVGDKARLAKRQGQSFAESETSAEGTREAEK